MNTPHPDVPISSCETGNNSQIMGMMLDHFDELHGMAARHMAKENPGNSMQTTALVNEAVCRVLSAKEKKKYNDKNHFLAEMQMAMRNILIDHARGKNSKKRGGGQKIGPIASPIPDEDDEFLTILILREELNILRGHDPLAAAIVEYRYQGYSVEEAAGKLGISRTSAYELWNVGSAWLSQVFTSKSDDSQMDDPDSNE